LEDIFFTFIYCRSWGCVGYHKFILRYPRLWHCVVWQEIVTRKINTWTFSVVKTLNPSFCVNYNVIVVNNFLLLIRFAFSWALIWYRYYLKIRFVRMRLVFIVNVCVCFVTKFHWLYLLLIPDLPHWY
jgi:hypothetical protein